MKIFLSFLLVVALVDFRVNAQDDWENIEVVAKDKVVETLEDEAQTTQSTIGASETTSSDTCLLINCDKDCPLGNKMVNGCNICECNCCETDDCTYDCKYGRKVNEFGDLLCECATEPSLDACKGYCMNIKTKAMNCPICPLCFCNSMNHDPCPPIECNTVCTYGYLKDYNGCYTCKCKRGPNEDPYSDPCDKCSSHEYCKMVNGYAVCVPHSTPSYTLPPIKPPKCPNLVCGEDCPCDHIMRSDGCTVCRCANACYGVACPPETVCFPEYTFQFYSGKFEVKPSCRRVM